MRIWHRYVLVYLAMTLIIALITIPMPSTPAHADDNVRIDVPANGADVSGRVEIRGRATTADPSQFSFYRLHYGQGDSPAVLRPIGGPADKPVVDDVLGVWDTAPLLTGPYLLLLTVYDQKGNTTTSRVVVNVLPAPTPTPRTNQPPLVVVPGATPNPDDQNSGPTPTPIPELPQLDPNIPQIYIPQQDTSPPVQPVIPQQTDPGIQPITVPGPAPAAPPSFSPPPPPSNSAPIGIPTFEVGPGGGAPSQPIDINAPPPPPPPMVQPFQPNIPSIQLPPTPTPEGLPL
jgi:hypothetical protein